MKTGTPISKAEYKELRPDGRAILKACHYIADPEATDAEYPLQLSTGRNVYQFHTRTKTGRSKPLEDACPEPIVRINETDAADLGIRDGEQVIVKSRRGAIQVKAGIGKISRGQTFIPFHFGYFDSEDGKARAANELTQDRWDSVSKQPRFKSDAVRIEKCTDAQLDANTVVVKSQQDSYEQELAKSKPNAADIGNDSEREQYLAHWLALNRHHPFSERYHTKSRYGHDVSIYLRDGLFPKKDTPHSSYETLVVLTGLQTYISNIEAHLSALLPVSQALWDAEFVAAVQEASFDGERMKKWVRQQLSVRAAQTLVVPDLNVLGEDVQWTKRQ
ncbi:putative molybdopterin dinucleotide-binding domain, aspartate decarboxylase-like domain superfamily [Septoria linicola]|nr:putative molybdopterin dinucleotide-binding domain, aspartate decarboxylase-like domain superfamily [Septoria linicola]